MSSNGPGSPPPVDFQSPSQMAQQLVERLSLDSDRRTPSPVRQNGVNGHSSVNGSMDIGKSEDLVVQLQRKVERIQEEKATLEAQHNNLLAKVSQMRTTLGNKLKQDAEELDRQEQLVQQLTAQIDDLNNTVETLKFELVASNAETERVSHELDMLRNRALHESAQENLMRERELREVQSELERCRIARDEFERAALHEKAISDDAKSVAESLRRELELEREARAREASELENEREKSANLQSVLQDFQSAKDHELRQAVKDYDSRLTQVTQSLAEFKHRALTAELQLEESQTNISRTRELEKEVKEKNLLIGKLRHEAVIINEHLMEALRRLRRNSTETNVDRRLVTNVLLAFITTPRTDSKRFEMLSLLSSILSWTDQEREKAGLQRSSLPPSSSFWGRSSSNSGSPAKSAELDKSDETESFSRLWVEFLLTEAAGGETPSSTPARNNTSLPGSPVGTSASSPTLQGSRRLASLSSAGLASSPNLSLFPPPPSRKGKEKEQTLPES